MKARLPRVHGIGADPETRCAHYGGPRDRIAIRTACCDRYFCCHRCHEALADHPLEPRPPERFHERAVLCGACGCEMTAAGYLAHGGEGCPTCGAAFNPGCARHRPLYFGVDSSP